MSTNTNTAFNWRIIGGGGSPSPPGDAATEEDGTNWLEEDGSQVTEEG